MPIGRRSLLSGSSGAVVVPNSTASGALRANAAVAITNVAGNVRIVECSASSNGALFHGFCVQDLADGEGPVAITTLRGSIVSPIVKGGGTLVAGSPVFLSDTLGEVSNTAPNAGVIIEVGPAVSITAICLAPDQRTFIG